MTNSKPLRFASAIVRLAYLRQLGQPHLDVRDGQLRIALEFTGEGPFCRCCMKPLCRSKWMRSVIGDYERELVQLLQAEEG